MLRNKREAEVALRPRIACAYKLWLERNSEIIDEPKYFIRNKNAFPTQKAPMGSKVLYGLETWTAGLEELIVSCVIKCWET